MAATPLLANTLVVDSGGIINAITLSGKAEKYVTIPEVFDEIKDEVARQRLATLPFDLEVRQPSEAALRAVTTFARTTGDLKFLSAVDVHVLAMTYMVAAEARGWGELAEEVTSRLRRITDKAAKIVIPGAPSAATPAPAGGARAPVAGPSGAAAKPAGAWGSAGKAAGGAKPSFASLLKAAGAEEAAAPPAPTEEPVEGRVRFADPEPQIPPSLAEPLPAMDRARRPRGAGPEVPLQPAPRRSDRPAWPPVGFKGRRPLGTSILGLVAHDAAAEAVATALATVQELYPEVEEEVAAPVPVAVTAETSSAHAGSHILSHGVATGSSVRHVAVGQDEGPAWVAPTNLASMLSTGSAFGGGRQGGAPPPKTAPAACVTVDFTMQNVLLGMGLRVLAANGRRVKRIKQFVLKCDSCFNVIREMDRLFCPRCGHATLARLGVTVDGKGRTHYHYAKNRRVNTRGQVYSYGKPKGGRRGDLLLSEDQLLFGAWAGKARRKDKHESMWADGAEMMHSVSKAGGGFGGGWSKPMAAGAGLAPSGLGVRGNKNVVVGKKGNPNARKGRERRGAKKKNKKH